MANPEIILEIKTYADGVLVARSAKIIEPHTWDMRVETILNHV